MKSILYVTLIEDPINNGILNSQVISVLKRLVEAGHRVTLFSAPSKRFFARHTAEEVAQFQARLDSVKVKFLYSPVPVLTNASIRFFLIPWLVLFSLPAVLFLALRENADVIHCRSYPASLVGMLVKMLTGKKFIFDMRGVYPEEGGFLFPSWHRKGLNFNTWKWLEKRMLVAADNVVVVSECFKQHVLNEYPEHADAFRMKIVVIICGVSSETTIDRPLPLTSMHDPVRLVYSGTLDGWTTPELLAKTYRNILDSNAQRFVLNIYTTSNQDTIRNAFSGEGIGGDEYAIQRLKADEVAAKLRENDIGILVRESSIVNEVSFPVKLGEYLAAGLPVIINSALIGAGEFVLKHNVGVVLGEGCSIYKMTEDASICRSGIRGALEELSNASQSYVAMYAEHESCKGKIN